MRRKRTERFPILDFKNIHVLQYVYDFKGQEKDLFWDSLLATHPHCEAYVKGDTMFFACYNCTHSSCYFKIDKERLKKEGVIYLE